MNATTQPCPKKRATDAHVAPFRIAAPKTESAKAGRGEQVPALDLHNLWDIVIDTGGPDLAIQFLDDYMQLLRVRMSRIQAALNDEDPEASINAVLSLKTSSHTVGALEIAERCGHLLSCIAAQNFQLAHNLATPLGGSIEAMAAAFPVLLEQAKTRLTAPPRT